MAEVTVSGVSKSFGADKAVDEVTIHFADGGFYALLGPSGSGKTSLLNLIGAIDEPSSGRVLIDGIDLAGMSDDERAALRLNRLGFIFQHFNLVPVLNAIENVELPLLFHDLPATERRERARSALKNVGLGDRLHRRPAELSGGEQQRVAIARALVTRPAVLLADEPTGNLDSDRAAQILTLFKDLNEQQGITIVLVTHEMSFAAYATRHIVFRDGRIISDDAVSDRSQAAEVGAL